jgi:protein-L-isoaspartate(D-aspartate) O-methyltransferase
MTGKATAVDDPANAARLRDELTSALITGGWITDDRVTAAFRAVPRHLFAPPGTSLEAAYADDVIRTKFDLSGTCLSSVSAPRLQAVMIRQAGIRPGMRVLEVGSGGCNAALLAEVTGPGGHVVSIDIDPGVTAAAAAALNAAGYAGRVTVITGDAEHGAPGHAPFDAVIVTVGAPGIAPSWISQAADDATLVVPLRMNGWTRSIAFRKTGSHLASTSVQPCGFVPLQGDGALIEQSTALDAPGGGHALVRAEDPAAGLAALPWDLLSDGPHYTWSGITIGGMASHADLYLWLGGFTPGSCKISAEDGAASRRPRPARQGLVPRRRRRPLRLARLPRHPQDPRRRLRVRRLRLRPPRQRSRRCLSGRCRRLDQARTEPPRRRLRLLARRHHAPASRPRPGQRLPCARRHPHHQLAARALCSAPF